MQNCITFWLILFCCFAIFSGCDDDPKRSSQKQKPTTGIKIQVPKGGNKTGDNIAISASVSAAVDSIVFYSGNKRIGSANQSPYQTTWQTSSSSVGKHTIKATTYPQQESASAVVTLISDITPETKSYRIINTYPHDPKAYTQGLIISDGLLYEGTGERGRSDLRKVALETGEVIEKHPLDDKYFGEGITLFNDQIIQLTYTSKRGFVYDKKTFTLLKDFYYPSEGWGLTHNDSLLIMSDGSSFLYFLNPQTLREEYRLEVYSDRGPVIRLNELEYINGVVYANVYQSDFIVKIDPTNGKVIGWIDLSGLLTDEEKKKLDRLNHVLNGIAYDHENDRLFVTGKMWPKLFEIKEQ